MKMANKKDKKKSKHTEHKDSRARKEKKKHKKVVRRRSSSSGSSSTSGEGVEWVEKTVQQPEVKCRDENLTPSTSKGQGGLAREDWLNLDSAFPCLFSTGDEKKQNRKKKEDSVSSILVQPGQSSRELNPYWKNGGTGLPETDSSKSSTYVSKSAAWLRKGLQRAKEQAEEEGKSLEEIAAERWGSLSAIESMIRDAERTENHDRRRYRDQDRKYDSRNRFSHEKPQKKLYKKPVDDDYYTHSGHTSNRTGSKNWQRNKEPSSSTSCRSPDKPLVKESPVIRDTSPNINNEDNEEPPSLTEAELNKLGAKIVKAEIMGDTELAAKLKSQLETARGITSKSIAARKAAAENVILTRTDSKGIARPLEPRSESKESSSRKKRRVTTHEAGERVRHYFDDDKYSLQELFQREKGRSTHDDDAAIAKIVSKNVDLNEIFEDQITVAQSDARQDAKERAAAINEHKRLTKSLENCRWCVDSKHMLKHMIVAMNSHICLSLPSYASLTEGHCILTPVHHIACQLQLDEDIWEHLKKYKQSLCKMFQEQDLYPVFFEVYKNRNKFAHMQLECVPLPNDVGHSAPMYFKKALLECETEWSINKKVIDLKNKTLRQAIPVGLSYFVVQFGLEGGYGHVIEDSQMFPSNFAEEIIGGMLDLDHDSWRKPRKDSFEQQREKVLRFSGTWKKYNCDDE